MFNGQMELGFRNEKTCRSRRRREVRRARANWWFERMRQVVDQAIDRRPLPMPRPEQMVFVGTHRLPTSTVTAPPRTPRKTRRIELERGPR